jgi:hypothetical protein
MSEQNQELPLQGLVADNMDGVSRKKKLGGSPGADLRLGVFVVGVAEQLAAGLAMVSVYSMHLFGTVTKPVKVLASGQNTGLCGRRLCRRSASSPRGFP